MLYRTATALALLIACRSAVAVDAAALLTQHCLPCHSARGAAPIRFDSADSVQRNRQLMRALVEDRTMPPWLPDDKSAALRHDRRLSDDDRSVLLAALASREAAAIAFAKITAIESNEVTATMLAPESAWTMPATGGMRIRSFSAPLAGESPTRVRGVAFVSNPTLAQSPLRVVSLASDPLRVLRVLIDPGESGYESMGDVGLTPSGSLGALTRVSPRFMLPDGFAFDLPRGDVVIETTSEPIGRDAPVQPRVTFISARESDTRLVEARTLRIVPLRIRAGETVTREVTLTLDRECDIIGVIVKGGAFVRAIDIAHHDAAGCASAIIAISDFRLSLSEPWLLATPMHAEAGSTIEARFGFDNTEQNPLQPAKPPRDVVGGLPPDHEDASVVILLSPRNAR